MIYAKWVEQDGRFAFSLDDNGGVQITEDEHLALIQGEASGKVITTNNKGCPILVDPVITPEQIASVERGWRNSELDRADIELNKVQDGMGTGTVTAWREYRCALRNWPEHESFPDSAQRPVAPDAPKEPTTVEPTVGE